MITAHAKGFTKRFKHLNTSKVPLNVSAIDVARAAVTVGGPVRGGSLWAKSQRRAGITATIFAALTLRSSRASLTPSTLFVDLESTEKGGVSFRIGMAMAAIVAEHFLDIRLLEHLNASNTILMPDGGNRRADLFGFDANGTCHVIEAKARTHGYGANDVSDAKQQATNVMIVDTKTGLYSPRTRSASMTDLSRMPIDVLLEDPPDGAKPDTPYTIDTEALIAGHYSPVPDLIELMGEREKPPRDLVGDAVGAFLPGTEIWLGIRPNLLEGSRRPWLERLREIELRPTRFDDPGTSVGRDGHILQLGNRLSDIYESWRTSPGEIEPLETKADEDIE